MRTWWLYIIMLLVANNAVAEEEVTGYTTALYDTANQAYADKNYQTAADSYEKIVAVGQVSPTLYYNLGNAYFRLGNMGKAILNYERAVKLDPSYDDAAFNLKLANLRIADRIVPAEEFILIAWYHRFLQSRSASGWGIWALAFVWLALLAGALYALSSQLWLRRLGFGVMGLLLIGSVVLLLFARQQYQFENTHNQGIIIVTNTYVKAAPDQSSTDLFILREGAKVSLLETEGGWQKVRIADAAGDKVGWVREDVLGLI